MKKIAAALALVAGVGIATVESASAGEEIVVDPDLEVVYNFNDFTDFTAFDAADGAVPELFDANGALVESCTKTGLGGGPSPSGSAGFEMLCFDLTPGATYTLGVSNVGDYFVEFVRCGLREINEQIELDGATFVQPLQGDERCDVFLAPKPLLHIDKIVTGSDEVSASGFPLQIFDENGLIAETFDPSDERCEWNLQGDGVEDASLCAGVRLAPGSYTIGETLPDYGYVARGIECELDFSFDEQDPAPVSAELPFPIAHSEPPIDGPVPATLCRLTNDFVLQDVNIDLVVINDDGGTAEASEFTLEVFNNVGALIDTTVDPDPAEGNAVQSFKVPIGDYTFGVSGPEGYTSSAVVTVTPLETATEIIPTGADFTLTENQTVLGVITVDDPPAEPAPTTVPPTTAAPTTAAPTTAAPTTLAPAPAPPAPPTTVTMLLPETGSTDQTWPIALLALGALVLGSGAILATRRR